MNSNNKNCTPDMVEYAKDARIIQPVGYSADKVVGIEVLPSDEGGWDVVACFFDDNPYINDWVSIGNAEEVNNFATKEEARLHGIEIIEQELGPVKY